MTKELLSAMELVRLYATQYYKPSYEEDAHIQGQPIWSNHLRNGKQVFWPYHWLIREDGTAERLLEDHETGWHAGKWEVNCRSVAITLYGDFDSNIPSDVQLASIARIISSNYSQVAHENIIGHCEVNPKKSCPGVWFMN